VSLAKTFTTDMHANEVKTIKNTKYTTDYTGERCWLLLYKTVIIYHWFKLVKGYKISKIWFLNINSETNVWLEKLSTINFLKSNVI